MYSFKPFGLHQNVLNCHKNNTKNSFTFFMQKVLFLFFNFGDPRFNILYIWLCIISWEFSTLRDTWIETETIIMVLFFLHANVKASGRGPCTVNRTYGQCFVFLLQTKGRIKGLHTEIISFLKRDVITAFWELLVWWWSSGEALSGQFLSIIAVLVDLRQRPHKAGPFVVSRDCDLLW